MSEAILVPESEPEPSATWILRLVFGASGLALVLFWVLMLAHVPQGAVAQDAPACEAIQRRIRAAFETLCRRKGLGFPALVRNHGKGATLSPLFGMLQEEGLLAEPLKTSSCRSYKDYTVLDAQEPSLDRLSCRIHGGHSPAP